VEYSEFFFKLGTIVTVCEQNASK